MRKETWWLPVRTPAPNQRTAERRGGPKSTQKTMSAQRMTLVISGKYVPDLRQAIIAPLYATKPPFITSLLFLCSIFGIIQPASPRLIIDPEKLCAPLWFSFGFIGYIYSWGCYYCCSPQGFHFVAFLWSNQSNQLRGGFLDNVNEALTSLYCTNCSFLLDLSGKIPTKLRNMIDNDALVPNSDWSILLISTGWGKVTICT